MLKFTKMHGLSNDFVIIDCRETGQMPPRAVMAAMTHRKTGVGCDQLIPILPPQDSRANCFMRIINSPDASEAQACGNATRCVADLLIKETGKESVIIQTVAGLLYCNREANGLITVDMGVPRLSWNEIPLSKECDTLHLPLSGDPVGVNIGNPHCVFFLEENVETYPVREIGPTIEHNPLFPEKTNVEFCNVLSRSQIRMRVWERDSGETEACGSAACATIVAAVRRGFVDRKCDVILNGGTLFFDWRESDNHLFMTGPVAYVFKGEYFQGNYEWQKI